MGPSTTQRSSIAPLRAASLLAAVLAIAAPGVRAASAAGTSGAKASVDFHIVIPVVLRMKPVAQVDHVSITDAEIARGYVDVEDATSMRVASNSRSGFAVSLSFDARLVARVVARIHGREVDVGTTGSSAHIDAEKLIDAPLQVGYRLFIAPGTPPGTYRWPVTFALVAGA